MAVITATANLAISVRFTAALQQNPKISRVIQQLDADDLVELWTLDLSSVGGSPQYFTASIRDNGVLVRPVTFGGVRYQPIDFVASGFEWNGRGTMPTPTFRISNTTRLLSGLAQEYDDMVGCRMMRDRTFGRFLDDGIEPDSSALFQQDVFNVERKVSQNKQFIEFELSAAMDQQGRKLPGRRVLRDVCTHRYRVWNPATNSFDYSKATCPYNGANSFDRNGNATTSANDDCSRLLLTGCKVRFGSAELPTYAFPGVSRVRIN